jgi:hypothetical protein
MRLHADRKADALYAQLDVAWLLDRVDDVGTDLFVALQL